MLSLLVEPSNSGNRGRKRERGRGWKRSMITQWHIFLFITALSRNPSIPAGPYVCFHRFLVLPPSSLLQSNSLTALTGWGAFLTSPLPHPSLSQRSWHLHSSWMIHKHMIVPLRNAQFTRLSNHSTGRKLRNEQNEIKQTLSYFYKAAMVRQLSLSKTEQVVSHSPCGRQTATCPMSYSFALNIL